MNQTIDMDHIFEKFKSLKPSEIVLDIRTPEEYLEAHIPGALNIPLAELELRLDELKKYNTLYVHCRSGRRVQMSLPILEELKGTSIFSVEDGGIVDWLDSNYPTESSS